MTAISVRALPGRVVYDAPRGGKRIPSDKFVKVQDSYFLRRLIDRLIFGKRGQEGRNFGLGRGIGRGLHGERGGKESQQHGRSPRRMMPR